MAAGAVHAEGTFAPLSPAPRLGWAFSVSTVRSKMSSIWNSDIDSAGLRPLTTYLRASPVTWHRGWRPSRYTQARDKEWEI